MELDRTEQAGLNAGKLLAAFREKGRPVFHVRHLSIGEGATFFLPGTDGALIHDCVRPQPGEIVIEKNFPNSFRETGLEEIIRNEQVSDLVICGAMSHMCIDATTRAAADIGFNCTVIHDACAAKSLEFADRAIPAPDVHGAFMAALGAAYAKIMGLDNFFTDFV